MPAGTRKRPFYLVVALLLAIAFGAVGTRGGLRTIELYRDPMDRSHFGDGIADEADRTAVVAAQDAYQHELDLARARAWPLGVATFLLGSATLFFAMRAMAGSASARAALVQLLVAQAATNAASAWLLRDVDAFEIRRDDALQNAAVHMGVPEKPRAEEVSRVFAQLRAAIDPVALAVDLLGSTLIVVALTRRRARDFFESPTAVGER